MDKVTMFAYDMLAAIEQGRSFTYREWDDNMAQIELSLGKMTPRARYLAANIEHGQAKAIADAMVQAG